MTTEDDFLKSLGVVSQHIFGMEADRNHLKQQLIPLFLKGLGYEEIGNIVQQAPNFAAYNWQEFEQEWKPPKLRKKNATTQDITEYQQKKHAQNLGYEVAACIARHAYFRRDLRRATEPNSLMPYVKVHIDREVKEFPFNDGELTTPTDPRFSSLSLEISPDMPSVLFTRQRTK